MQITEFVTSNHQILCIQIFITQQAILFNFRSCSNETSHIYSLRDSLVICQFSIRSFICIQLNICKVRYCRSKLTVSNSNLWSVRIFSLFFNNPLEWWHCPNIHILFQCNPLNSRIAMDRSCQIFTICTLNHIQITGNSSLSRSRSFTTSAKS